MYVTDPNASVDFEILRLYFLFERKAPSFLSFVSVLMCITAFTLITSLSLHSLHPPHPPRTQFIHIPLFSLPLP